jgi:hypothetical protein
MDGSLRPPGAATTASAVSVPRPVSMAQRRRWSSQLAARTSAPNRIFGVTPNRSAQSRR